MQMVLGKGRVWEESEKEAKIGTNVIKLSTSQQKVEGLLNVLLLDISFSSYSSVLMS